MLTNQRASQTTQASSTPIGNMTRSNSKTKETENGGLFTQLMRSVDVKKGLSLESLLQNNPKNGIENKLNGDVKNEVKGDKSLLTALLQIEKDSDSKSDTKDSEEPLNQNELPKGFVFKLQSISPQTVKDMMDEAKQNLKQALSKKVSADDMPNTLQGLVNLAKKHKLNLKDIDFKVKESFKVTLDKLDNALSSKTLSNLSTEEIINKFDINKFDINKPKHDDKKGLISLLSVNKDDNHKKDLASLLSDTPKDETIKFNNDISQSVNNQTIKVGSLEYKMNEAKTMVSQLSQNIKDSIDNYKPPFTRLKMVLNPAKLGEVEVTMVQRNNAMHVNINANQTTMQILLQNAPDLKSALESIGLNNTSMNFSSQQQGQNQQNPHEQKGYKAYKDISEDELENTTIGSLELIVPQYI